MGKTYPPRPWPERALDGIATTCTVISGVCMVLLIVTFAWLVYGRYVLNATPTWVEQLSLLLIITITFLSAAVGVKEGTHLKVDILPAILGPGGKTLLSLICHLVLGVFGLIMSVQAWGLIEFSWSRKIPLLGVSEAVRYVPVFISGVLITLFCLHSLLIELKILGPAHAGSQSPNEKEA